MVPSSSQDAGGDDSTTCGLSFTRLSGHMNGGQGFLLSRIMERCFFFFTEERSGGSASHEEKERFFLFFPWPVTVVGCQFQGPGGVLKIYRCCRLTLFP